MTAPVRILMIAGARPNFMKLAPLVRAVRAFPSEFVPAIVHTGQHYDRQLSNVFFDQLGIPAPDINLNVGSGSHAQQTAAIMAAFEPVVLERRPGLVIVVGDVNSTIACALVAVKLGVPVAHVEAGLRSFDRSMPEEINRVLTDQISDLLFTTEESAADNLRREGVSDDRIHFVGNVMIDTLLAHVDAARSLDVAARHGLTRKGYGLLTLHRPANVDEPELFERLITGIAHVAERLPLVFPVHPRTQPAVHRSPGAAALVTRGRLIVMDPLGYLEFVGLMDGSAVTLTDSGGVQEETTILGVPCLTLRENTERPVTITHGTNRIVGSDPARIAAGFEEAWTAAAPAQPPPLWDGGAAGRIVDVLRGWCARAN